MEKEKKIGPKMVCVYPSRPTSVIPAKGFTMGHLTTRKVNHITTHMNIMSVGLLGKYELVIKLSKKKINIHYQYLFVIVHFV